MDVGTSRLSVPWHRVAFLAKVAGVRAPAPRTHKAMVISDSSCALSVFLVASLVISTELDLNYSGIVAISLSSVISVTWRTTPLTILPEVPPTATDELGSYPR